MKQITAQVRPSKLDIINNSLVSIGVIGMTVCEAKGYGKQMGQVEV
jgi:nitrogen regulatory protein P-II 2